MKKQTNYKYIFLFLLSTFQGYFFGSSIGRMEHGYEFTVLSGLFSVIAAIGYILSVAKEKISEKEQK